jgi:hypothetical protein
MTTTVDGYLLVLSSRRCSARRDGRRWLVSWPDTPPWPDTPAWPASPTSCTCASTPRSASRTGFACSRRGAPTSNASPVTWRPAAGLAPAAGAPVADTYRHAVEEDLPDHSPAVHLRRRAPGSSGWTSTAESPPIRASKTRPGRLAVRQDDGGELSAVHGTLRYDTSNRGIQPGIGQRGSSDRARGRRSVRAVLGVGRDRS